MSTLRDLPAQLRHQWHAQVLPDRRLLALLLLVPAIALLYATLVVRDALATAATERAPLLQRAARLRAVTAEHDWAQRIASEQALLEQLDNGLWRAETPELAAADLQTVLQRVANTHLAWNRLKLAPAEPVAAIAGWRITADLSGKLKADDPLALLQELASHRPGMRIDLLEVSRLRAQTITLRLGIVVAPEAPAP